jgi:DNA-binding NarL/FixJ family response regulator
MSILPEPLPAHRILIADDAPSLREALRWLFKDEPGLAIVGEAGDGRGALVQAAAL